eukprot:53185-Pyramimonas_sp.AAC.1
MAELVDTCARVMAGGSNVPPPPWENWGPGHPPTWPKTTANGFKTALQAARTVRYSAEAVPRAPKWFPRRPF